MTANVVFALDIGVYKIGASGQILAGTTAAWCRLDRGIADLSGIKYRGTTKIGADTGEFVVPPGEEPSTVKCGRSIEKLADAIAEDLEEGRRVALGFEAPMWFPLKYSHEPKLRLFRHRFKAEKGKGGEQGREWYLNSGAAATVKAISLGIMLREHLRCRYEEGHFATTPDARSPGTVTLFESFVTGRFKVEPPKGMGRATNEWDALISALAWDGLHADFEIPEALCPVSLHRAGSRTGPCFSVWDTIFAEGPSSLSGPPDCEVVALKNA